MAQHPRHALRIRQNAICSPCATSACAAHLSGDGGLAVTLPRDACCPTCAPGSLMEGGNCLHCWSAAEMAADCTSPTALLNPKTSAAFVARPLRCGSARIALRRGRSNTRPGLGCGRAACCGMTCARLRCGGQACRPSAAIWQSAIAAAGGAAGAARRGTQQTRSSGVGRRSNTSTRHRWDNLQFRFMIKAATIPAEIPRSGTFGPSPARVGSLTHLGRERGVTMRLQPICLARQQRRRHAPQPQGAAARQYGKVAYRMGSSQIPYGIPYGTVWYTVIWYCSTWSSPGALRHCGACALSCC